MVSSGSHGPVFFFFFARHAHAKRVCRWPMMAGQLQPSSPALELSACAPHRTSAGSSCGFTGPAGLSIHRTYCPVGPVPDHCGAWPKRQGQGAGRVGRLSLPGGLLMGRLSLPGGHRASAYQVGCNGASLLLRWVQAFPLIRWACWSVACLHLQMGSSCLQCMSCTSQIGSRMLRSCHSLLGLPILFWQACCRKHDKFRLPPQFLPLAHG